MCVAQAVRRRVARLCRQRGINPHALALQAGLPCSSLASLLDGRSRNPTIRTIKLICDGLGITLGEFFDAPEFDALEQELR